jgi:hypothetical protein
MQRIFLLLISSLLACAAQAADQSTTQTPVAKPGAIVAAPITTTAAAQKIAPAQTATITLYESPVTTSKVMASLPQQQALIVIFKQGDWIKVANPQDGMVGWVKKDSLNSATVITVIQRSPGVQEYKISQQNKNGSVSNVYRVMQYSNTSTSSIAIEQK